MCKWKGLTYCDCTWEGSSIIVDKFQDKIDDFLNRQQSPHVPHKNFRYSDPKSRKAAAKRITVQPEYITEGTLRSYQLEGVSWLAYLWSFNINGILADEMGLGKTVQTISFLRYLYHEVKIYGPFIIVVPLSVLSNWQNEFNIWAPEMNVLVYIGNSESRQMIRTHEFYFPNTKRFARTLISC